MTLRDWQGSVFRRGQKLYLKVRSPGGKWTQLATPYRVGQEDAARAMLRELAARSKGEAAITDGGPLTVEAWGKAWLKGRVDEHDEQRLRLHVYPVIGRILLEEVRPRHLLEVIQRLKAAGAAPRTIRNVYSVVQGLFRDAVIADLVPSSPCVLRRPHLPTIEDRDAEWRAGAVFSRAELEQLIARRDEIEADSRVVYALLGLAMLRHGEMAGLRWRHYDAEVEPLGRLVIACSYTRPGTKTVKERWMPAHPALAAILAAWKLSGWADLMGREPRVDDWIVPVPEDEHGPDRIRSKEHTWTRLQRHLAALEWRRRRVHDLRRTGISLARADGADRDVLKRGTHAPPREIMELYTSVEWERLCGEVAKLKIGPRKGARIRSLVVQRGAGARKGS